AGDVDSGSHQLFHAGNAPRFWMAVTAPFQHQINRRVGDHVDAGVAHLANDPLGVGVIPGGHGAAVSGCNTPLPAVGERLVGQQFQRLPGRIVRLVDVHVHVGVVVAGDGKGDLDVPGGVVHIPLAVGHTADEVGAVFHRLPHQVGGLRVSGQSKLGKGDELDFHLLAVALARCGDAFQDFHAGDVVNVHVAAQPE